MEIEELYWPTSRRDWHRELGPRSRRDRLRWWGTQVELTVGGSRRLAHGDGWGQEQEQEQEQNASHTALIYIT